MTWVNLYLHKEKKYIPLEISIGVFLRVWYGKEFASHKPVSINCSCHLLVQLAKKYKYLVLLISAFVVRNSDRLNILVILNKERVCQIKD